MSRIYSSLSFIQTTLLFVYIDPRHLNSETFSNNLLHTVKQPLCYMVGIVCEHTFKFHPLLILLVFPRQNILEQNKT